MNCNYSITITLLCFLLAGCGLVTEKNKPWRQVESQIDCTAPKHQNCINSQAILEKHESFEVGYIEFSERGNAFNQKAVDKIYSRINELKNTNEHVAVVVYVHGWKHNAKSTDSNVLDFHQMLNDFSSSKLFGDKKVFGVYLGWRGLSAKWEPFKFLSFWERKAVAEEIGRGGVTRVFSQLNRMLISDVDAFKNNGPKVKDERNILPWEATNNYVIIGHSFGGAIVLSAIHEVLTAHILESYEDDDLLTDGRKCKLVPRFADAITLLNPAIEANAITQLKEVVSNCDFESYQPRIMHTISSEADLANGVLFPIGQFLGVELTWNQIKDLEREIDGKPITLNEHKLDRETIGNLEQFWTGRVEWNNKNSKWDYFRCREDEIDECGVKDIDNHFPNERNDPLIFLQTDGNFIDGHGDLLKNCNVKAYLSTLVLEQFAVVNKNETSLDEHIRPLTRNSTFCDHREFDFGSCFEEQLSSYSCSVPNP